MAKRFIDTKIWDKAWFRKLKPETKLLWIYMLTKCDHAGILDGDWEAASFFIGSKINDRRLPSIIKDKMVPIDDDQYFIPSFVEYQYGQLRSNSRPHLSVIKRLEDKGLNDYLQRVTINNQTLKDKDKDKDKVKVKVKERAEKFALEVVQIGEELKTDGDEIIDFIDYWTETNERGTKFKAEMQQTFDIKRRLNKWIKNNKEWEMGNKKNERKQMQYTGSKSLH